MKRTSINRRQWLTSNRVKQFLRYRYRYSVFTQISKYFLFSLTTDLSFCSLYVLFSFFLNDDLVDIIKYFMFLFSSFIVFSYVTVMTLWMSNKQQCLFKDVFACSNFFIGFWMSSTCWLDVYIKNFFATLVKNSLLNFKLDFERLTCLYISKKATLQ